VSLEVDVVKAVRVPVRPSVVRAWLVAASEVGAVSSRLPAGASVAVRMTGDRELRRLNRSFLGEDRVTDVLSFPSGDDPFLGDIAVSWPAVVRQAAEYGHEVEVELALLCIHGFLHLLGWDHASPADEARMWRLTRECLVAAGVGGLAAGRLPSRD
jgi:probable rRNA maturation factor